MTVQEQIVPVVGPLRESLLTVSFSLEYTAFVSGADDRFRDQRWTSK